MQSWQTTVAGLGCIAAGVYLIAAGKGAVEGAALIAAGIGLVRAKDSNVHSTEGEVKVATAEKARELIDSSK